MKIRIYLLLLLFVMMDYGPGKESQKESFESRIDRHVKRVMKLYGVPGLAIGIVRDGKIIFKNGYGHANIKTGQKTDTNTLFGMASVSKSFTATAVMQLAEHGFINLDDPVSKHVPYFILKDERYRLITIRMLLNHTSGIPTMYKAEFNYEHPEFDGSALKRYLKRLYPRPLEFDPGEKHAYSNHGYALLAALIECVSEMPFEQYMKEQVLKPLGMDNSHFLFPEIQRANLAAPHVLGAGFRYEVPDYFPVNRWAAGCGGLYSSIDEMCNWLLVCLQKGILGENRILSEMSYNNMWTVSSPKSKRMGLGWFIDRWLDTTLVSHPGGGLGYSAECCLLPEHNLGVAVVCNARKSPVWNIASAAFRMILGKKVPDVSLPLNIQMLKKLRDGGIESAIGFYRLKREELPADEFWLTQLLILGHRIMVGKHPDKLDIARKILELNVEFFPEEAYAHDVLAEAYLKLAMEHYRKAVKLDPTNWGAREIMGRLK